MRTQLTALIFLAILGVSLSACTKEAPAVEYGQRTATGTLVSAELSLVRRGTHRLIVDGKLEYYVESRTENLSAYEGQVVVLEGITEPNTKPEDTPVLVVQSLKGLDQNVDLRRFEVPELNIRIGIPAGWNGKIEGKVASFSMPEELEPLLTIRRMSGSTLPPGGSPMFIKNRRTTRISLGSNASEIYVLDKDTVIQIHFDPAKQGTIRTKEDGDIVAAQFERSLSTLSFISDRDTNVKPTATGALLPCGGELGTLCPTGSFCDIKDFTTRSGVCKTR